MSVVTILVVVDDDMIVVTVSHSLKFNLLRFVLRTELLWRSVLCNTTITSSPVHRLFVSIFQSIPS